MILSVIRHISKTVQDTITVITDSNRYDEFVNFSAVSSLTAVDWSPTTVRDLT